MRTKRIVNLWKKGLIAGLVVIGAISGRADEQDQFWLTGAMKWTATKQLALTFAEQARFKDETYFYRHTDFGGCYAFNKAWAVAPKFRLCTKRNAAGDWRDLDGYLVDTVNRSSIKNVALTTRIRLAYVHPDDSSDDILDIRPKLVISPVKGYSEWNIKPYVADELMYNVEEDSLHRNRLSVGFKTKPASMLLMQLFVMQECLKKDDEWAERWNAGLDATLLF